MQCIQGNHRLDVVALLQCLFSLGEDYEDHGTHFFVRRRKVQHYINTVIEYGHFRLKIAGISRLALSQRESSPCSEFY